MVSLSKRINAIIAFSIARKNKDLAMLMSGTTQAMAVMYEQIM